MKKRLIATLLAIILFLSAIPGIAAEAEEHPAHAYIVELIRKHLNESELLINDFMGASGFTSPVMRISFDWRDGNESIRATYHNPPDKSRNYSAYPVTTLDKISFFNYVMSNYSTISSHLPAGVELQIEIFETDGTRTTLNAAACLEWAAKADGNNDGSEKTEVARLTEQETHNLSQKAIDLSGLSFDELVALKTKIDLAIWNSQEWQEVTVPQGVWVVGEDIPAGTWTVTCATEPGWRYCYLDWGEVLQSNGQSVAVKSGTRYDYKYIYNPNYRYYEIGDGDTSYTFTVRNGDYIVIKSAPAVFTPYAGQPSLGFK